MIITYDILDAYGKPSQEKGEAKLISIIPINGTVVASLLLKDGSIKFLETNYIKGPKNYGEGNDESNNAGYKGPSGVDASAADAKPSDNGAAGPSDSGDEQPTQGVRREEARVNRGSQPAGVSTKAGGRFTKGK